MALTIDTVTLQCKLPKGTAGTIIVTKTVDFATGDIVELKVKKSVSDTVALISKSVSTFTLGKAYIEFTAADSEDLDLGCYFYDIVWEDSTGKRIRLIPDDNLGVPKFTIVSVVSD